ncbi:MAG: hypothetical protein GY811_23100 [Myxococcales bacterium]|nr:hypothetical protein [Myxococcales bacterium]
MTEAPPDFDAGLVDLCEFSPAEPAWVVEGEPLTVLISCSSGASLDDLQLGALPEGASFDGATKTLAWTPGLDQAAVYDIELSSADLFASGTLQIGVADAFGAPSNVPIADPSKYTMELGLPVIFLAQEPAGDAEYEPMQITNGGTVHEAEAKLRGKSSLSYPKKSYALRFDKFDAFGESKFADFSNRTRVILTSTFDDNSYVRQRMAFDLWAKLEPSIPTTAYSAVVYRELEYRGIYTVTDHVNAALMARNGLSDSGNVYKAENHDANFLTTANNDSDKSSLHQGYSKTEGEPEEGEPGAFDDMDALVSFVANSDDATFNGGIAVLIDIDDYAAWWLHVTFILANDSAGKNSYHYHDEARTWRVAPWDLNDSLGQNWQTRRTDSDDYETFFSRNELFRRLLGHPTHGPAIRLRYKNALETGAFSEASLSAQIDWYEAEMHLSAARDWARWESEYRSFGPWSGRGDFTSHEEELEYVRDWIALRWQFALDSYTAVD